MIAAASRPRLVAKARLRFDRKTEQYLLLYPERGLVLNQTAVDIVRLCTGERTVAGIVEHLVEQYRPKARDVIEREVLDFLGAMADRGLVQAEG
jgi:pyrroloquinoline quinone biosynthesis protein D